MSFKEFVDTTNSAVRPYLTFLIATIYNVALVFMVFMGMLTAQEYVTSVGTANGLIIGFWFGERKAKSSNNTTPTE